MFHRNRAFQIVVMSVLIASTMVAFTVAAPDDTPAPEAVPATTQAAGGSGTTRPAEVSADAAPVLEKLASAYKNLKSLELAGTLSGDFDIDGEKANQKIEMSSTFAAPNQFRHAMKDDLVVGSTGEQLFVFEGGRKLYKTADAPRERTGVTALPDPFDRILLDQNLSLALAVSKDPAAELGKLYEKISKADDVQIDGKAYPALALANKHEAVTLAIDPQTNLIRRASSDITRSVKQRGAQDVVKAVIIMDYPTSTAGATTRPEQFAWTPPAGARDASALQPDESDQPAMAMLGKPAPDFALKDLNDKDVKFAELKGNVLVLDFWATWCPPCVAAMPALDKLAGEMKDQGVKVLAIDADEEKELVQGFVNSRKFENLIVLLDPERKVAAEFQATDVLPTTLVVGKDGTVRKVIIGGGPQAERDLRSAVEEALRASK